MARVLFLDDEQVLVNTLPSVLEDEYEYLEVRGTTNIQEALILLENEAFDIMLLDISMPPTEGMDLNEIEYGRLTGVAVAQRIKNIKPELPIVALTVVRDPVMQQKMREAGVISIINKPAEIDKIAQVLLGIAR